MDDTGVCEGGRYAFDEVVEVEEEDGDMKGEWKEDLDAGVLIAILSVFDTKIPSLP